MNANHILTKPIVLVLNRNWQAHVLPHEAGLKLLNVPRAPKDLPATALIRNSHSIAEWRLFVNELPSRGELNKVRLHKKKGYILFMIGQNLQSVGRLGYVFVE